MGLFKKAGDHEAARAAKDERRAAIRRSVDSYLEQAKRAAADGDILAEEKALARAYRQGTAGDNIWGSKSSKIEADIQRLVTGGKLRRCNYIGFAGPVHIWKDRIVFTDQQAEHCKLLDEHVRASLETAGQLRESRRPTLTRMAIGSALPGSALVPGLALQKKEVHDTRELYFTLEHPEWARVVELDADTIDPGVMRQIVVEVNQAAREAGLRNQRDGKEESVAHDALDRLQKLGELRSAGVLTESEFEEQKAKALDSL
jgi:hypothetical protein